MVQLSGVVKDKTIVRAKSLEVKLAPATGKMQVIFGECVLDVGEMPSKEAAISSARESDRAVPIGSTIDGNGRNGSGEPKDVLPGLTAEALADQADDARKGKSAPPKRA